MTRTRYRIFEDGYPYFLTCTIMGWLPVFTRPESVQIVFKSWIHLASESDFRLYGYVVLENHLHLIASAPNLANVIKSFKMFTARQIIDLLEAHGAKVLLRQLRTLKLRHKTDSEYEVWEEGSKPKQIGNDEMMRQKLEYIHNNPVKRGYVDDPMHWRYSSARNYAGMPGLVKVITNWR
jgi:REP element-mobilizing transposase RayT